VLIEVNHVKKNVSVIINLDMVREIAPVLSGGCLLYFGDDPAPVEVTNHYNHFKQFVLETVTADHIAKRVDAIAKAHGTTPNKTAIPKL
jgi:hypothetical protein